MENEDLQRLREYYSRLDACYRSAETFIAWSDNIITTAEAQAIAYSHALKTFEELFPEIIDKPKERTY